MRISVDQNYEWQPMSTCPVHEKVQLIGRGGLPTYALYDGRDPFWVGWAPLPNRPRWLKDMNSLVES